MSCATESMLQKRQLAKKKVSYGGEGVPVADATRIGGEVVAMRALTTDSTTEKNREILSYTREGTCKKEKNRLEKFTRTPRRLGCPRGLVQGG